MSGLDSPSETLDWEPKLASYLAERGLRITRQRKVIADAFFETAGHPTMEELLAKVRETDKNVGQATVYRTLRLLVEAGLAEQSNFGDGTARYEPVSSDHHDHLVCRDCGRIVEFYNDTIERLQDEIAKAHSFAVEHHEMVIYARCTQTACPHKAAAKS